MVSVAWAGTEETVTLKLYAKLAASFGTVSPSGQGSEFLLLAHPGIPISPKDCESDVAMSLAVDQVPQPSLYFQPSGKTVSGLYATILEQAEVSNFQDMADRQKALNARRKLLDRYRPGHPTPEYAAYLKYRLVHRRASDALALAIAEKEATGKQVPEVLEAAVGDALKEWKGKGFKEMVEEHRANLDAFLRHSAHVMFASLGLELRRAATPLPSRTGGQSVYWPAVLEPSPDTWYSEDNWAPFRLTEAERSLAAAKDGPPLQDGGGEPQVSDITLTMETKRVQVTRPWLESGIFEAGDWRMPAATGMPVISSGSPFDGNSGTMPLVISGLLLSRRLKMVGRWMDGKPALGPVALGGTAKDAGGRKVASMDGVQIIGFFCVPVPKCPDPDPKAFRGPER